MRVTLSNKKGSSPPALSCPHLIKIYFFWGRGGMDWGCPQTHLESIVVAIWSYMTKSEKVVRAHFLWELLINSFMKYLVIRGNYIMETTQLYSYIAGSELPLLCSQQDLLLLLFSYLVPQSYLGSTTCVHVTMMLVFIRVKTEEWSVSMIICQVQRVPPSWTDSSCLRKKILTLMCKLFISNCRPPSMLPLPLLTNEWH